MMNREISAGGVVAKIQKGNLELLLIKDSYGRWTWPTIREIGEETGLEAIEVIKQIGKTQYFYRLKGRLIFKTVFVFLFRLIKDQKLKIQTEEIQAGKWFSPEDALKRVEYKGSREILKKAINLCKGG